MVKVVQTRCNVLIKKEKNAMVKGGTRIKRQDDHIHIYSKDIFLKCYYIICCYNLHSSFLFLLQKSMNTYFFLAFRIRSHLLP
jgi:hypothetical protein